MKATLLPQRQISSLSTLSLVFLITVGTLTPNGGMGDAVLLADFDNVNPTAGNWADFGNLFGYTESGLPFGAVAGTSGVQNNSFVLSDIGLTGQDEFGLETELGTPLEYGCICTWFSVTPDQRNSELRFDWYEPFDRGVDLLGISFNPNAQIQVDDSTFAPTYQKDVTYLVRAELEVDGGDLAYEVVVIDTSTGATVGSWTGVVVGPVDSIAGAMWTKGRTSEGRFVIDDIEMTFLED